MDIFCNTLNCKRHLISLLGLALWVFGPTLPQSHAQGITSDQPFVNTFARPGQPTIRVYILGSVGATGIWRIERQTDLVELLSAARVAGIGQDQPDYNQRVNLRIYRTNADDRRKIYDEQLSDILAEGTTYPPFQEGDVLEVETERRRTIGLALISQVIGAASSVTLLILRLTGGR